jgi:hypothetical protein
MAFFCWVGSLWVFASSSLIVWSLMMRKTRMMSMQAMQVKEKDNHMFRNVVLQSTNALGVFVD